jgi:putative transposase
MKKKTFSEEEIALALRQYLGMGVAELRRLKQLEEENRKLKRIVADLTLDKQMLQDVLKKKW